MFDFHMLYCIQIRLFCEVTVYIIHFISNGNLTPFIMQSVSSLIQYISRFSFRLSALLKRITNRK